MSQFSKTPTMSSVIRQQMINAIFGSNAIEFVGSTAKVTQRLCDLVFTGKASQANLLDPGANYEEELDHAASIGRKRDMSSVIRGRREIIQHAIAFRGLVQKLVIDNEKLSEDLIQATHISLCHGTEEHIGGVYRTHGEAASWGRREETDDEYKTRVTNFLKYKPGRPAPARNDNIPIYASKFVNDKRVPALMAQLVKEFNNDTADPWMIGHLDAPILAAKHSSAFVNIHPFEDGNGRVCRMLLNVVLIKYMGVCIEIGTEFAEREEWIRLSNAANKAFSKEFQDDVDWDLRTSYRGISALVVQKLERLESSGLVGSHERALFNRTSVRMRLSL